MVELFIPQSSHFSENSKYRNNFNNNSAYPLLLHTPSHPTPGRAEQEMSYQ